MKQYFTPELDMMVLASADIVTLSISDKDFVPEGDLLSDYAEFM